MTAVGEGWAPMIAVRTLSSALGAAAIVLGFVLVPALLPDPIGVWAGQVCILIGWAAVLVGTAWPLARVRRAAVAASAVITVLIGFALVFGLPGLGDSAPRTLGLVAVILGLIAVGWVVLRARISLAPLLAGALALLAIYGLATLTIESYVLPGAVRTITTAGELANFGRWVTLTGCAFVTVLIGRRPVR